MMFAVRGSSLLPLVWSMACLMTVQAFGVQEPVSKLLQQHVSEIARLKEETQSVVGSDGMDQLPYNNDLFYLRYCLDEKKGGMDALKETLAWRQGAGKSICLAATQAVAQATSPDGSGKGKWNNDPVRNQAPSAAIINQYITTSTCLTTSSNKGDLVYCIRAGKIDDKALMSSVTVDQMVDFFLYAKEVNALVANDRSLEQDRLVQVITVNDLKGLQLIGGDATFRQALGAASKQANSLYPATAGPTLLLNLPRLVSALVKLFTPLFPPEVNARLKFERGPLEQVDELIDISYGGKDRASFMEDLDRLCYQC